MPGGGGAPASVERVRPEIETAVLQWEEGYERLQATRPDPAFHRALGRLVVEVQDELRRRLGSTFTVAELVSFYRDGTDWCLDLAIGRAPEDSRLWDLSIGADAAFYLYMREAADFAGGRVAPS
jgi:hypothetical protein